MIGYAELNEAFRHFKEFGNTVIFLNLLESTMVCAFIWYNRPSKAHFSVSVSGGQSSILAGCALLGSKPDQSEPT